MSTISPDDRYTGMKLGLACPKCGSAGLIPWHQLHHVLCCRGCEKRFRVARTGLVELPDSPEDRIQVQIRTNSSGWKDHAAVLLKTAPLSRRLLQQGAGLIAGGWARWVISATLLLLLGSGIALAGRKPAAPPPLEIPTALEGRAALFCESLARRDMGPLIRLTDPAEYRALRSWVAHGLELPAQATAEESDVKADVVAVTMASADANLAVVRVRLPASSARQEYVADQQWARRAGSWYFQPVKLRSVQSAAVRSQPYVKRARPGR